MHIPLLYGKDGLSLDLPDDWEVSVLRKRPMPLLDDPRRVLREGLAAPCGCPPLRAWAVGRHSACILICDITRPVPNGLLLPVLIQELLDAGLAPEEITVLVATGLHRPNEGDELRELVGNPWVLKTVRVSNHFARNDEDHVALGVTRRGTPVRLDRRFVNAEVRIVTGLVEPHLMAGYSGGRKLLTPGIAHAETIATVHNAAFLEHPQVRNCRLAGNILHEEQLEIARMVGPIFGVNVVLDEQRRVTALTCGALEAGHQAAVDFIEPYAVLPIPAPFRTVVSTSAGYPLDKTYYQSIKGIVGAQGALAPGSMLFLAAECSEGLGSAEFVAAQRRLLAGGEAAFLTALRAKPRADIDEWQTELLVQALRGGRVGLFSDRLSMADHALTGVTHIPDLPAAVRRWVAECGDSRVAVIPEGPYVIPMNCEMRDEK